MQVRSMRDNVLAGFFVVAGLLVGVWGSFLLGGKSSGGGLNFCVRFPLQLGADGLKPGSPVLLGGQQIGQVVYITFHSESTTESQPPVTTAVDVFVEVDKKFPLYEDAAVFLEKPLLGTLSSLNIVSVGSPLMLASGGTSRIEMNEIIAGAIAPPSFLKAAGFGPDQSRAVGEIIRLWEDSSREINLTIKNAGPEATSAIRTANKAIETFREKIPQWQEYVSTFLKNAQKVSEDAKIASEQLPDAMTEARSFLAKGNEVGDRVLAVIDENRASIKATILSVESATGKIDQKVIDEVSAALLEADRALDSFAEAVTRVDQIIQEGKFDLKNTLANMSLASQEMKLAMSEIRSAPWRVFYKPGLKERETEDLYGAAAAFAEASLAVRSASEALASATQGEAGEAGHAKRLERLAKALDESLAKYDSAGKRFMEELLERQ